MLNHDTVLNLTILEDYFKHRSAALAHLTKTLTGQYHAERLKPRLRQGLHDEGQVFSY